MNPERLIVAAITTGQGRHVIRKLYQHDMHVINLYLSFWAEITIVL